MVETMRQESGLTKQRDVVLRVIRASDQHMTANEVFVAARVSLSSISFATVYNSLRYLKEAGHIAEIHFGNGASRYDRKTDRHDHAMCTRCGALVDIELDIPGEFVREAERKSKFKTASIAFTRSEERRV